MNKPKTQRRKLTPTPKPPCHKCGAVTPFNQPVFDQDNKPVYACGSPACLEGCTWDEQ